MVPRGRSMQESSQRIHGLENPDAESPRERGSMRDYNETGSLWSSQPVDQAGVPTARLR